MNRKKKYNLFKKFFSLTLIIFALNGNIPALCAEILHDEITTENFDDSQLHKNTYTPLIIQDEFIALPSGETGIRKEGNTIIEDEIVKTTLKNKKLQKKKYKKDVITDEQIVLLKDKKQYKKILYNGNVDTEIGYAVQIKPLKKLRTKNSRIKIKDGENYENYKITLPEIGEEVVFKVIEDVNINGKTIIPKDSYVYAKVDNVSPRAMGGAPAEMRLDNFILKTSDGKELKLSGSLSSSGYTLSPWIGLAELATTPFLFGLAVPALRVLSGGQAVITPRKTYTVYYTETKN